MSPSRRVCLKLEVPEERAASGSTEQAEIGGMDVFSSESGESDDVQHQPGEKSTPSPDHDSSYESEDKESSLEVSETDSLHTDLAQYRLGMSACRASTPPHLEGKERELYSKALQIAFNLRLSLNSASIIASHVCPRGAYAYMGGEDGETERNPGDRAFVDDLEFTVTQEYLALAYMELAQHVTVPCPDIQRLYPQLTLDQQMTLTIQKVARKLQPPLYDCELLYWNRVQRWVNAHFSGDTFQWPNTETKPEAAEGT